MNPIRLAALTTLLLACGGPQDPATEDLTASQHEAEAEHEEEQAAEHDQHIESGVHIIYGVDAYDPADGHLAEAEAHRAHAEAHRERAEALRLFEEAECSRFPPSARAACPFLLGLEAVEDVGNGARLTFADGADVAAIVDHIRCHLAFVASQGSEGIDDCALYVPGAGVERVNNVVVLTTDREDQITELRRRVRVQMTH